MLYLALLIVCMNNHQLLNTPLEDSDREITLSDIYLFNIDVNVAKYNYNLAKDSFFNHKDEVQSWNIYQHYIQYERDSNYRMMVWNFVHRIFRQYDKLEEKYKLRMQLMALYDLRDYIGRDNYYAGLLPFPTENLRVKP